MSGSFRQHAVSYLAPLLMCVWFGSFSIHSLAATAPDRLLPLEVVINGSKSGTWLLLEHAGELYAPHDAFEEWRVQLNPEAQPVNYKDQNYYPLFTVPGYRAKLN